MDRIDIRPISERYYVNVSSPYEPKNYTDSSTTIGSGADGTITVTALGDITTTKKIETVLAEVAEAEMSVAYVDNTITVTLGTDDTVSPITADDTKNTAILIAAEIDALELFTAVASGEGTGVIPVVTEKTFTAGNLGTPCGEAGICFQGASYYYVNIAPDNSTNNTNWRRFTLAAY